MKVFDVVQGTEAWRSLRLGIPTSSQFDRIITPRTGKPSSQAEGYMLDLLAELVLGHPLEKIQTTWMQRGTELESQAVDYYELQTDSDTTTVGLMTNDAETIGASPDRIVNQDLLLEVKCPSAGVHMGYVLGKSGVDADYRVQLQGQLYISECKEVDIISYHPGMPHAIVRIERDEEFIKLLDKELADFLTKLHAKREQLDKRGLLAKPKPQPDHSKEFLSDEDVDRIIEAQRIAQ